MVERSSPTPRVAGPDAYGAIRTKPDDLPASVWVYYIGVTDLEDTCSAAAEGTRRALGARE